MTPSEALQQAVFETLLADAAVSAVVGENVYDGRPQDRGFPCITFGATDLVPVDDIPRCVTGRVETMQIDCWVRAGERLRPAKALADAVYAVLHRASLDLAPYRLVEVRVAGVRAFMDPDGLTGHGVVTLEAEIEGEGD